MPDKDNLPKIGPPSKIGTLPKIINLLLFSRNINAFCTCGYVKQEALEKEGLTNEGRHHLLLLHKHAHDKSRHCSIHCMQHLYV